jgi:diguanylate cyclase (GGDEF)-like protein
MSTNTFVNYSVAFCIQFAAVLLALSLIKHLRFQKTAALVLAAGLSLMAIRRLIPFQHFFPPLSFLQGDHYADSVLSIVISLLLFSGLFGLRKSMSRLKDYTDLIENRSRTDYLTGAWNRLEIERRIEIEISRSRRYASPLALVLFDIDHFKQINDNYGHESGDEVLRNLVDFCQKNIREIDVLGRFGGEEFLILMPSTDEGAAFSAAERLREGVEQLVCAIRDGHQIRVTISLGVSVLHPQSDADAYQQMKQLIGQSDQAMYLAKQSGRNQTRLNLAG